MYTREEKGKLGCRQGYGPQGGTLKVYERRKRGKIKGRNGLEKVGEDLVAYTGEGSI